MKLQINPFCSAQRSLLLLQYNLLCRARLCTADNITDVCCYENTVNENTTELTDQVEITENLTGEKSQSHSNTFRS